MVERRGESMLTALPVSGEHPARPHRGTAGAGRGAGDPLRRGTGRAGRPR